MSQPPVRPSTVGGDERQDLVVAPFVRMSTAVHPLPPGPTIPSYYRYVHRT